MLNRREFLGATVLGTVAVSAVKTEEKPITTVENNPDDLPFLRWTNSRWFRLKNPNNLPEGTFYLNDEKTGNTAPIGESFKFKVLNYREKAERFSRNPANRYVSYDHNDEEFKRIKTVAQAAMHCPLSRKVTSDPDHDGKGICIWGIEPHIQIYGIAEARWMLNGRKGLAFVCTIPENRTYTAHCVLKQWDLRLAPGGGEPRKWYTYEIREEDGVTDLNDTLLGNFK